MVILCNFVDGSSTIKWTRNDFRLAELTVLFELAVCDRYFLEEAVILLTYDWNLVKYILKLPADILQPNLPSATWTILAAVHIVAQPLFNTTLAEQLVAEGAFFWLIDHQRTY